MQRFTRGLKLASRASRRLADADDYFHDRGGGYDDRGGGYDDRGGGYDDRRGGYDDRGGDYYYDPARMYGDYYAPRKNYASIAFGVGLVIVNVCAMIAMTCTDPMSSTTRGIAVYVYAYVNSLAWIMITTGVVLVLLNLLTLFKTAGYAQIPGMDLKASLAILATGALSKYYGGKTLEAVQDAACEKKEDKADAWRVTGGLTVGGLAMIYFGMNP
tara:strand:- start:2002 stop:2646 length:645 start_codon:yes stop_codon:yes gene_type:complete